MQRFGRQRTKDGEDPIAVCAPDRTTADPVEPDTDNFLKIPPFGSTGSAGKPYACISQDESTGDSDDCRILDVLDVMPVSYAYPLQSPSATSAAPNPSSAPGQAADSAAAVSGEGAQTRKRAGSANPEAGSPAPPAKKSKVLPKPGAKPKKKKQRPVNLHA